MCSCAKHTVSGLRTAFFCSVFFVCECVCGYAREIRNREGMYCLCVFEMTNKYEVTIFVCCYSSEV